MVGEAQKTIVTDPDSNNLLLIQQTEDLSRQYDEYDRQDARRLAGRIIRFIVWVAVILIVILCSLLVSAWIAGFRFSNGFPDMVGMIHWILNNYQVNA